MKARKTIRAKIAYLTAIKRRLLEEEYGALQRFLHGGEAKLYSANKQQALRFYRRIKPDREYPLSIRKDLLRIERTNTMIAEYWARIPVKGRTGGVWVALKPHCPIGPEMEICESKLFKLKQDFYLHIVVTREVEPRDCHSALAVDLGVHNVAATVNSKTGEAHFHGKKLREELSKKPHIPLGVG